MREFRDAKGIDYYFVEKGGKTATDSLLSDVQSQVAD